jgi:hypothetical protein
VPACTTQVLGAACPDRGETCDPGADCGELLLCTDSDPQAGPCPISERKHKRAVSYLGAKDLEALRRALLDIRLATYKYRHEGPDAPDRLGFVIDDLGESPAVNPDRATVDLYGYASMAVAAVQAQQREIESLRREVAELRRRLEGAGRRR